MMEELIMDMEPGEEDFNERLGKKPELSIAKVEVGEPEEIEMEFMPEEEDEDSLLKKRLMKMRG